MISRAYRTSIFGPFPKLHPDPATFNCTRLYQHPKELDPIVSGRHQKAHGKIQTLIRAQHTYIAVRTSQSFTRSHWLANRGR